MNRTDPTLPLDNQADEIRMRRALGLQGNAPAAPHQQRPEQARQRHRFAQDGSVPVVMLNRGADTESGAAKERITALEAMLEAERGAHAATRRLLQESQTAHQALQTRLAHTELAHAEAMAAQQRALKQAQEAAVTPPTPVEAAPAEPAKAAERPKAPARQPRAVAPVAREPKPVRWWTASYRTKKS